MEKITIRPLEITDVLGLLDYANTLSAENTYVQLSGEKITEEEERKFVEKRLSSVSDGNSVHLVVIDKIIAAYGWIERLPKRSHHVGLLSISVAKSYRGKGIGKKLIAALMVKAKNELHLRMIILHCFESNTPALSLYNKMGFKEVGIIPGFFRYNDTYVGRVTMYASLV